MAKRKKGLSVSFDPEGYSKGKKKKKKVSKYQTKGEKLTKGELAKVKKQVEGGKTLKQRAKAKRAELKKKTGLDYKPVARRYGPNSPKVGEGKSPDVVGAGRKPTAKKKKKKTKKK